MSESRELIWVSKELADEYNNYLENELTDKANKLIKDYIDQSKMDYKLSLETLEEDLVLYRSLMLKARNDFKKAKEEQLQASYEIWEKFENELPSFKEKINQFIEKLEPLKKDLNIITKTINEIDRWGLDKLIKIIEKIGCLDGKTEKFLKFLVENYKEKK